MKRSAFLLFISVIIISFFWLTWGVPTTFADNPVSEVPNAAPSSYNVPVTELPSQASLPTDTPTPTPVPIFEPQLSPWLFIVPGIVLFAVIIF